VAPFPPGLPHPMPLTKPQLAAMLFEQLGLNEREAEDLVEGFYEEISRALAVPAALNTAWSVDFHERQRLQQQAFSHPRVMRFRSWRCSE
jgi:hypothetical protein